jgi:Dyp-type peroxidase family
VTSWTYPTEPALEVDEIQGHVLIGFGSAEQAVGALTASDLTGLGAVVSRWAAAGRITSTRDLLRRKGRNAREVVAGLGPWTTVAVSGRLLRASGAPASFDENWIHLEEGMAGTGVLNDPSPLGGRRGSDWVVGAPSAPVNVLVVTAAATRSAALDLIGILASEASAVASLTFTEPLAPIIGSLEHFGFRDGVSQPALFGTVDGSAFDSDRAIDDPERVPEAFGTRQLIWPGEFVFGYPGQSRSPREPGRVVDPEDGPTRTFARNGSMLVYRRLAQDVAAFRRFCEERAAGAGIGGGPALQAQIVGRHPSGCPLTDAPEDVFDAATDNAFTFGSDEMGAVCPPAAHIRKVNPRQAPIQDLPIVPRLLRRGAPYGPRYQNGEAAPPPGGRGLAFLAYQTNIGSQFVRLTKDWINEDAAPQAGGHDLLIGQIGGHRARHLDLVDGTRVEAGPGDRWVSATGGAFLFTPSISALRSLGSEESRP